MLVCSIFSTAVKFNSSFNLEPERASFTSLAVGKTGFLLGGRLRTAEAGQNVREEDVLGS